MRYWLAFLLFLCVMLALAVALGVFLLGLPFAPVIAAAVVLYCAAVELDVLPPGRPLARARREAKLDQAAPHTDMDDALYRAAQLTGEVGAGARASAGGGHATRARLPAADDPLYAEPRYSYLPYTPPGQRRRHPFVLAAAAGMGVIAAGGLWFGLGTLALGGGGSNATNPNGVDNGGGRVISGAQAADTPTPAPTVAPGETETPEATPGTPTAKPTPRGTKVVQVASLTGRWQITDSVTSTGEGSGQTYRFIVELKEAGSAITGLGDGLAITGTRQGNLVQVQFVQSGHSGVFEWTATSDDVLQGSFSVDNGGSSGRSVGSRIR